MKVRNQEASTTNPSIKSKLIKKPVPVRDQDDEDEENQIHPQDILIDEILEEIMLERHGSDWMKLCSHKAD